MSLCPKHAWGGVKAALHSVFDRIDAEAVHAQYDKLLDQIVTSLPGAYDHLDAARTDVLAEQHDEWADGRRYLGLDVLTKSRLTLITTPTNKETTEAIGAISSSPDNDESRDVVHHATGLDPPHPSRRAPPTSGTEVATGR